jgi:hypothetical protein
MSKVDQTLLTPAEYARHRGCTRQAVHEAARAGRITLIDGKVDPVAADAQWAARSRPRVKADRQPPPAEAAPDEPAGYGHWRARRERADALAAEHALAELRGELLRREVMERVVGELASRTKEAVLQIKGRIAPLLAAETDVLKITAMLDAEFRSALRRGLDVPPAP